MNTADILIIGGGIAGASAGALLAEDARVIVLEAEAQPGYHATGRSAAYFAPAYGNAVVRNLTAPGSHFFSEPPEGFSESPLLIHRASMFVARADQAASVAAMKEENPALVEIDAGELESRVPILRGEIVTTGLLDSRGGDLDVDAILQGYLRRFRACGGTLVTNTRVETIRRAGGDWVVNDSFRAPVVINAAGAWADVIAQISGLEPLGLQPKRRTAFLVDPPDMEIEHWPLTIGIDEDFYFKPDAGQLLISPADETPVDACDAQPDEMDIALAIDRVQRAARLDVTHIRHKWAGLRTFSPDKTFVVGFDPRASGFFWLAGQGGYGVQSAPGMSELTRHLLTGNVLDPVYREVVNSIESVRPDRLFQ